MSTKNDVLPFVLLEGNLATIGTNKEDLALSIVSQDPLSGVALPVLVANDW